MDFIIELLFNAAIILLLAYLMKSVDVRNYGTAVAVALVIGILNATVGWLLRGIFNLVTLFLLSFIVRLVVTAIVIKIADRFFKGFEVRGFGPALIMALVLALAGSALSHLVLDNGN